MPLRRVCVFCGAKAGNDARFLALARSLGGALAERNVGVVYGGAHHGLMGAVADGALDRGGAVIGIIPEVLASQEFPHPRVTDQRKAPSMHGRKALMEELSDAFIALPGGVGTLDELFEQLTWVQVGVHHKPIALLDEGGYFDALVAFLDRAVVEGFLPIETRRKLQRFSSTDALVRAWLPM